MKYTDYIERRQQGSFNFPVAFYHENPKTPRYNMPLHWHPECEIINIHSGSFTLTVGDDTRTYHAGEIVFVTDGLLHGGTPHDCYYDCLLFRMNMLLKDNYLSAKYVRNFLEHRYLINTVISSGNDTVSSIIDLVSDELRSRNTGHVLTVPGYLYILLGVILDSKLYTEAPEENVPSERLIPIKNVLTYVEEHYSDN
ncbi:MAG: AraC family ligand binding domain-containing protein, partial [Eubacterium sp.]|nr:AraC family ligand binding domain-containing protein [Eubacterium sp.]